MSVKTPQQMQRIIGAVLQGHVWLESDVKQSQVICHTFRPPFSNRQSMFFFFSQGQGWPNWCLCVCVYRWELLGRPTHKTQVHTSKQTALPNRVRVVWVHSAGRLAPWMFFKYLHFFSCCFAISQLRVYRHGENKWNTLLTSLCLYWTLKWIAPIEKWMEELQMNIKGGPSARR